MIFFIGYFDKFYFYEKKSKIFYLIKIFFFIYKIFLFFFLNENEFHPQYLI